MMKIKASKILVVLVTCMLFALTVLSSGCAVGSETDDFNTLALANRDFASELQYNGKHYYNYDCDVSEYKVKFENHENEDISYDTGVERGLTLVSNALPESYTKVGKIKFVGADEVKKDMQVRMAVEKEAEGDLYYSEAEDLVSVRFKTLGDIYYIFYPYDASRSYMKDLNSSILMTLKSGKSLSFTFDWTPDGPGASLTDTNHPRYKEKTVETYNKYIDYCVVKEEDFDERFSTAGESKKYIPSDYRDAKLSELKEVSRLNKVGYYEEATRSLSIKAKFEYKSAVLYMRTNWVTQNSGFSLEDTSSADWWVKFTLKDNSVIYVRMNFIVY